MARPPRTIDELWALIDKSGPIPAHMPTFGNCWVWKGPTRRGNGGIYGFFGKDTRAWWWTWEQVNGSVPEGMTLDHLCRNTICVNPAHLEPVPMRINLLRSTNTAANYARRTHCNNGHEYTPENTRITKAGARLCRTCRRTQSQKEKQKVRAGKPDLSHKSKTHCKHGHPFNESNTKITPTGARQCKTCNRIRARDKYRANKSHYPNPI